MQRCRHMHRQAIILEKTPKTRPKTERKKESETDATVQHDSAPPDSASLKMLKLSRTIPNAALLLQPNPKMASKRVQARGLALHPEPVCPPGHRSALGLEGLEARC